MLDLVNNRIWLTRVFALLVALLLMTTTSSWDHVSRFVDELWYLLGGILVAAGVIGRVWCFSYISGKKNLEIVQEGPYSMTRNPLYFFSFLAYVGLGLATETLTLTLIMVLSFALYYPIVIRREETFLRGRFGDRFKHYCERTPRFWPRLSLLEENPQISINGILFRKGLLDVIWFIILFASFSMVEMLHQTDVLPTLLHLY